MKGCFNMYKVPMGKFKGIPVYRVSYEQWYTNSTQDVEEIYVVDNEVYYHDLRIGYLNSDKQLEDFDEKMFNELRNERTADLAPKREEKPVKESVNPGTAVDDFMNTWQDRIDCEIVRMKVEIAKMGVGFNEVG